MQEPKFDSQAILEHDPESTNAVPALWDAMGDPRAFFADIYRLVRQDWCDDLARAATEYPPSW